MSEQVQGQCPNGCGKTLFLGSGGYVTCSWQRCPDPGRASDLLDRSVAVKTLIDSLVDSSIIEWARARAVS